ncbi:unnamed protein product [Kuraishia capsulata CBS 1993]|uniref:Sfi1 spindle body domain-containing protein n=1 Tax=Kuraishia capsulata CBS 1993 TaxID=1382522 RepID=W6MHZ8_9ASCO|nr:uncharacterized protein KUCA_T00001661001 [Kuraishia capsulata CBS 1993]CDK25691.1 unnamed protein product [Kuraishia capsulata CBS 1993]
MDNPVFNLVDAITDLAEVLAESPVGREAQELLPIVQPHIAKIVPLWQNALGISKNPNLRNYKNRVLMISSKHEATPFSIDCLCQSGLGSKDVESIIREEVTNTLSDHTLSLGQTFDDDIQSLAGVSSIAIRNVDSVAEDQTTNTLRANSNAAVLMKVRQTVYKCYYETSAVEEQLIRTIIRFFESDLNAGALTVGLTDGSSQVSSNDAIFIRCYRSFLDCASKYELSSDLKTTLQILSSKKFKLRTLAIALIRAYKRCISATFLWKYGDVKIISERINGTVIECLSGSQGVEQVLRAELEKCKVFHILDLHRQRDVELNSRYVSSGIEKDELDKVDSPLQPVTIPSSNDETVDVISLLSRIVTKYCSADSNPKVERWFPMILRTYINVLKETISDGYTSDEYYTRVKSATLKWKNREISSDSFLVDLNGLFHVLMGDSTISKNGLRPTLLMRLALARFKKEMKLKGKLLDGWYKAAKSSAVTREHLQVWGRFYKRLYMYKWINQYNTVLENEEKAESISNAYLRMLVVTKWKSAYLNAESWTKTADNFVSSKYLTKWADKQALIHNSLQERLAEYESTIVMKRRFDVWKISLPSRTRSMAAIADRISMKIAMNQLKKKMDTVKQVRVFCDNVHDEMCTRRVFRVWLHNSSFKVDEIDHLLVRERNFVLARALYQWKSALSLKLAERELISINKSTLSLYVLAKWRKNLGLQLLGDQFVEARSQKLLSAYFQTYLRVYRMTTMARELREKQLLEHFFNRWKMSLNILKLQAHKEVNTLGSSLKQWKLKTILGPVIRSESQELKEGFFKRWYSRSNDMQGHMHDARDYAAILQLRRYFQHFQHVKLEREESFRRACEYHDKSSHWKNEQLLYDVLSSWRELTFDSYSRRQILEGQYAEFCKSHQAKTKSIFARWRSRTAEVLEDIERAEQFKAIVLLNKTFNRLLLKWDHFQELNFEALRKVEEKDAKVMISIVRDWNLKILKLKRSEETAKEFKRRWRRNNLKRHFDIWASSKNENPPEDTSFENDSEVNPFTVETNTSPLHRFIQPRLSPVRPTIQVRDLRRSPDHESALYTPSRSRFQVSVPASERIRRMKIQETKMHYQKAKKDSPEKPPAFVRPSGSTVLKPDPVFAQAVESPSPDMRTISVLNSELLIASPKVSPLAVLKKRSEVSRSMSSSSTLVLSSGQTAESEPENDDFLGSLEQWEEDSEPGDDFPPPTTPYQSPRKNRREPGTMTDLVSRVRTLRFSKEN